MAERAPGFENYTPSRLEWLTVLLNSAAPYSDALFQGEFNRIFLPKDDGKTLVLMVSYSKDIESSTLEERIKRIVDHAKLYAAVYKWDSWLEIEVEHRPE